jgi:hypothetical protein
MLQGIGGNKKKAARWKEGRKEGTLFPSEETNLQTYNGLKMNIN